MALQQTCLSTEIFKREHTIIIIDMLLKNEHERHKVKTNSQMTNTHKNARLSREMKFEWQLDPKGPWHRSRPPACVITWLVGAYSSVVQLLVFAVDA